MTIRIVLVDDQALVRAGIISLLNLSDAVEVISEASDGRQALEVLSKNSPDIVLTDLSMPEMDGIELIAAIRANDNQVPILILTTFDDPELVLKGIQAGAQGYLLKDVNLDVLINAISRVAAGESLIQPALTERLIKGVAKQTPEYEKPLHIEPLSVKEKDVLRLVASGYSNKEIANLLAKSEGTIKNQLSAILAKLGARDRTRAVLIAIEKGLLED